MQKGSDSLNERFAILGVGAKFTGTGNIVIDSCKRLIFDGFEMPTQNIIMRGCWWSQFNNLMFKQLILNDALATSFNQSYWNEFNNCLMQNITKSTAGTNPANEFTFNSCGIRGNAAHGFTTTFNYAFNFVGNTNAQSWKFYGGDISYANLGVYFIDPANTADVELIFDGVYFDTWLPNPTSRNATIIESHACHNAIGTNSYRSLNGSVGAVTATITNLTNIGSRTFRYNGATHANLVPGGDFNTDLGVWVGANKPIVSTVGSTITSQIGGINGVYVNINQPTTTSNGVFFRRSATAFNSQLTSTLVIRNADVGSKTVQIGMFNLFSNVVISDTEWTAITLTSGTEIAAGANAGTIVISTTDSTAFNVDVAYAGCHYGVSAPFFAPSFDFQKIEFLNSTFNPASIPANSQQSTNFTVTGAALGDFVLVSTNAASALIDNVILSARVSAADTVTLTITNPTAGAIDLPVLGLGLRVWKRNLYV